jgi:hypothetical protein
VTSGLPFTLPTALSLGRRKGSGFAEGRRSALGKDVDHGLPRLTGHCRELNGAVDKVHFSADGQPSASINSFFIFGLSFFCVKGTIIKV